MKVIKSRMEIRNNTSWVLLTLAGLGLNLFLLVVNWHPILAGLASVLCLYALWHFIKG